MNDVRKRIRIRLADLLLGFQCSNLDAEYRLPSIVKEKKVRRTLAAASQVGAFAASSSVSEALRCPWLRRFTSLSLPYFYVTSSPRFHWEGRYRYKGQVVARCTVGGFEERYEVTRPLALESRRGALATRLKGEVVNTNSTERRGCEHKLD
ncbi:hypothetical protein AtNW77_MTg0323181 (mitochondrion) [Arabidopsis thaliana]